MISYQQQQAIDYITNKFQADRRVDALLISGSISHGFNDEFSDVDINIIVSNEIYEQKKKAHALTYFEDAENFYKEGYFDGKFITLDYLDLVVKQGNEPTKFAFHDSKIAFDKTGQVENYLEKIRIYNLENVQENAVRFVSQLDGWKWYADEGIRKRNKYLLDIAVSRMILFAGRLILLENRTFFPYHKWFMKVLENVPNKPQELMPAIERLLNDKSAANIEKLYELIKNYKDWSGGARYSWTSNFVSDVETVWMRGDEFIENL